MEQFILKDETYQVIGICMEVHRILGHDFSEIVYKDAISIEAASKQIEVSTEKEFTVYYKDILLNHKFYADFVMFGNIIVEIKACDKGISNDHIAQTINYLKISECSVGVIVNFGRKSLEYKGLVY